MAQTEAPPTEAPLAQRWLQGLEARYAVTAQQHELTRRVLAHWHRDLAAEELANRIRWSYICALQPSVVALAP